MLWLHRIRARRVYWALWAIHLLLLVVMLMMLLLLMLLVLLGHWRYRRTLSWVLHRSGRALLRRTWTVIVLRLLKRHLLIVRDRRDRHGSRRRRHIEVSRVHRVALAIVAVISRHGRSRQAWSRMTLLATVHMLLRHRRWGCRCVGLAQGRRRRPIPRTLESGGIHVRRPDLWHGRRRSIVSPWLMTLTLQTGGRLMTRQLTGRDSVRQRVRVAVSAVVRRRNRTKAHRTSRVAHGGSLRVRDEGRHSLHARHGATAAIGASLPVTRSRTDPRSDRSRVVVRV